MSIRIGIIGAGQLGQMLGFAARELGIETCFLDPSDNPPAACCGPVIKAGFDDRTALAALAAQCDVLTYEFENVAVDALEELTATVPVYPPPAALRHTQDRLHEKQLFAALGIPLAEYRAVDSPEDLQQAIQEIGLPLVLKTRRFGYDGKGQCVLKNPADAAQAWEQLGAHALIAEQWVAFDYEVSIIGVRAIDGAEAIYPLSHNEHRDGILHCSRAPVNDAALTEQAQLYLRALLNELDYTGVLALELFVAGELLLANEFAPRVHNSGHWSIEGSNTSQFSNHIRAIAGQAPGSTGMRGHAGMVNLIGRIPEAARTQQAGTLHDYGKAPRQGRKLGHITATAETAEKRDQKLRAILKTVN